MLVDYNTSRPHSRLGWLTRQAYAATRRSAPRTIAITAREDMRNRPNSSRRWIKDGGNVNANRDTECYMLALVSGRPLSSLGCD